MAKSRDKAKADTYVDALLIPYGGLGFPFQDSEERFNNVWPLVVDFLKSTDVITGEIDPDSIEAFRLEICEITNEYFLNRYKYSLSPATEQIRLARHYVVAIDAVLATLKRIRLLDIPRYGPLAVSQSDQTAAIRTLLKLQETCKALAAKPIKPGAEPQDFIRLAVKGFISTYERQLKRRFELSRTRAKGALGKEQFTAIGPRCLQIFFEGVDPKLSLTKLSSAIQAVDLH